MKSKIFSKTGIISVIIILITGILLINPDNAKALLFGRVNDHFSESAASTKDQSASPDQSLNNEHTDIKEYPLAPSVTFKDGSGKTIDISKQKGKVLFINFWATWCPPCIQEMPSIARLKKQFAGKDILFLMVDVDDNYKKSSKFMENRKFDLSVYTAASSIPKEFLSGSIPTTVVIDKEGRVVARQEGGADYTHPEIIKFFTDLTK